MSHRRVKLEIDLTRLRDNFRSIHRRVAPCQVMAVLKANAYGLGVANIAKSLVAAGAARIGVAELEEALVLKDCGIPVQILGGVLPEEIAPAVAAGIVLPITDIDMARAISDEAARQNKTAVCHFLIDTGMGRLGILAETAESAIMKAQSLPNLKCEGIYTHFPVAYLGGIDFTNQQIAMFAGLLESLSEKGCNFELVHIANSDGVNNVCGSFAAPFNLVRTGLNLYGAFDTEGQKSMHLETVLQLKTRLVAVRELPAGASLGYGRTYTLPRPMRIGTIAAGYADGMPMALSNRGHVLIHNRPCHVLGRVSMDYTTVDLSQAPAAAVGDEVTCLGGKGVNAVRVEDWARLKNTHSYDIICSIGSRVERVYIN